MNEPPALLAGYNPDWQPRQPQPLFRPRLTDYPNRGGELEGEHVVRSHKIVYRQIKKGRWYGNAQAVSRTKTPGRWRGHTTWNVLYEDGTTGILTNIELLSRKKV